MRLDGIFSMRHVFQMKKSIASRLRSRIKYQTRVVTHDICGGPVDEWTTAFDTWAEVLAISGKEDVHEGLEYSGNMYRVTIRYRRGVDPTGRIVLSDGTVLAVKAVRDPAGRRELLIIDAESSSVEETYIEQND